MSKRLSSLAIALFLLLFAFSACSKESAPSASSQPISASVDVRDADALYEFVSREITDIPRATFDDWTIVYADITGNSTDEAILISSYSENFYDKLEIVSGDSGQLTRIPSDIYLGHYDTQVYYRDGLLAVSVTGGGTGLYYNELSLYAYDGSGMVNALEHLTLSYQEASPESCFSQTALWDGSLTNFVYTLVRYDDNQYLQTVDAKMQYTYDPATLSYTQTALTPVLKLPGGQDYTFEVTDGSLNVQYDGMDSPFTLIKADYLYMVSDAEDSWETPLYVLSAEKDGDHLVFTAQLPEGGVGDNTYYVDMTTMEIIWVSSNIPDTVNDSDVRLSGLADETVRGETVRYGDYSLVIIPYYPVDGANYDMLSARNVEDDFEGSSLYFAIFGKLEDVVVTRNEDVNTVSGEWSLGTMENVNVEIWSGLQSDAAYYSVSGKVYLGHGQYAELSFNMDDVRDPSEYDITFIS